MYEIDAVETRRRAVEAALHVVEIYCAWLRAHSIPSIPVLCHCLCSDGELTEAAHPGPECQHVGMKWKAINAAMLTGMLLPHSCVLCGVHLDSARFCEDCRAELPWIGVACGRCGLPLVAPLSAGTHCVHCQRSPPAFDNAFAPLVYTFPVDSALKALKFRRQLFYAPAFGELLLPLLQNMFPDVDALLPVPLHRRRHASRGFNQAAELCRPLRRASGLPLIANVRRTRLTKPQTGLDATERRRNMKSAFEVRGALGFRHPLVIDDVITTGETCGELAGTLRRAGAERVSVLAVARAASA